ncbi:hypothetical protein J7I80_06745 [Bacillus sp. ISL-41]|uniref:hypothetical protein n=1 Tax=Bacillus sp. ISL-41 TaxID=2819127 RepID=UPI001BE7764D|nr:hypothetical protein [Bacillus sp. ISL-41]MBT2641915.1 hypothetical protein [Bacillus sp. ISL-41]
MEKSIIDNYIISLLAKPFVVLTGNSGTGKTHLALKVAEHLENKNYKVNSWLSLAINNRGRILNRNEEDIRNLCIDSNVFVAKVEEKEFEVQIEMNVQVESDDTEFWDMINEGSTNIKLGAAVRIPSEKRHVLIPVGADWTDSRNLLGYVNPFGPEGKTVYEITPIVELLLKALHPENRYLPHFIILDEMNLSHVERYFSSFLSAMEANRSSSEEKGVELLDKTQLAIIIETLKENPRVNSKVLESAELLLQKDNYISLPPNIFIIGTVNVDETTYMFSPKVLDRAHIIELETVHPSKYFNGSFTQSDLNLDGDTILNNFRTSIEYREKEHQGVDVLSQLQSRWHDDSGFEEAKEQIEILLSGMYSLLKTVNFDFGYRIYKETLEYLYFAILYKKSTAEWGTYMDNVILQKVLPKLHGNRRQLSDVLDLLIKYLNKEIFDDIAANIKVREASENYATNNENIVKNNLDLPKSMAKLNKMKTSLNNIGFTSFIG